MKIIAYTCLHYGRDYLAWAIRSVIDAVEEYHVLYSRQGSHGHRVQRHCPETRAELFEIAEAAAGSKLHWHEGNWSFEGQQRDSIMQYAPDADVILVLDADEIWSPIAVEDALRLTDPQFRRVRLTMVHFWRSFHKAILYDPACPIRIIYPKAPEGEFGMGCGPQSSNTLVDCCIAHMGYAQRPEIVEYKMLVHGHKNELRRDVNWFQDVFMANRQEDCHPVGSDYWWPEAVNPLDYMPEWMQEHPYFHCEVIE